MVKKVFSWLCSELCGGYENGLVKWLLVWNCVNGCSY